MACVNKNYKAWTMGSTYQYYFLFFALFLPSFLDLSPNYPVLSRPLLPLS